MQWLWIALVVHAVESVIVHTAEGLVISNEIEASEALAIHNTEALVIVQAFLLK